MESKYLNSIKEIETDLRKHQSEELYEHSIGTRDYALKLAEKHNLEIEQEKIVLAALLHDFSKEYNKKLLFKIAGEAGYVFDDIELENPYLLHGEVGAYEVKLAYGIDDEDVLNAMRSHTTGSQKMSDLDILIFIADKLERNRNFPHVEKLRKAVEDDFLTGALEVLNHHKEHVLTAGKKLHPRTVLAINDLENRLSPKRKVHLPNWIHIGSEANPSTRRDLIRFMLTMDGFIIGCSVIAIILTFFGSTLFGFWFLYHSIGTIEEDYHPLGFMRRSQPSTFFQNRKELLFLVGGLDGVHDYERTDTLMLVKLNFVGRTAKILSIPRDTLVKLPSSRGGYWDRINVAYPIGQEQLLLDTVANMIGFYPDYFVLVNYDGFKSIVDIVGGVEIDVEKDMNYDDYAGKLHIHLKKGLQVLNGEDALGYVRYRRDPDGDFSRIKRQQKFFNAFKKRLISPATAFKVDDIVRAIMANVQVSAILPGKEEPVLEKNGLTFQQYIVLAKVLKSLPDGNITSETIKMVNDGVNYHGRSVQVIEYKEFDKTMENFMMP